jgi:uncharacterized membrane protein
MMALLRAAWERWKRIARIIGEFQSRVLLTVFYFVLLMPFALVARAKDPLALRQRHGWSPCQGRAGDLAAARRQ